jgi:hypothetical protein
MTFISLFMLLCPKPVPADLVVSHICEANVLIWLQLRQVLLRYECILPSTFLLYEKSKFFTYSKIVADAGHRAQDT